MFSAHAGAPNALSLSLPAACSDHQADRVHVTVIITSCMLVFFQGQLFSRPHRYRMHGCVVPAPGATTLRRLSRLSTPPSSARDARCRVCHSSHTPMPNCRRASMHAMHVVCFSDASEGWERERSRSRVTITITISIARTVRVTAARSRSGAHPQSRATVNARITRDVMIYQAISRRR